MINHEITYDTGMKGYLSPRCPHFEGQGGSAPSSTPVPASLFPNTIKYFALPFRVNDTIHKYDKDNIVNWEKLHMFSKQTCICLTHSIQKVKKVGYSRKRRQNRVSPGLCSKVKTCFATVITTVG